MQDTDVITNEANKNQSALAIQPEDVIPSTLFRPEVESRMKENIQGSHSNELDARVKVLQESELNEVCNEAYDELLTQEFTPDQEDYDAEDYAHGDGESLVPIEELALVPSDKGMLR
jgi:hypothetical protein